jgi:hypothetical protein
MRTKPSPLAIALGFTLLVVLLFQLVPASALLINRYYLPIVYRTDPTATPTLTPTPTRTITPTPTRTKTPSPSTFDNPSFEDGNTGWVFQSNQGDDVRTNSTAYNGNWSSDLGNGGHNRIASISQEITVPTDRYYVRYYQRLNSNEVCGQRYDYVTIFINGSKFTDYTVCRNFNTGSSWQVQFINLTNYQGDTVVFRMEFRSDQAISSYVYVDDFSFQKP